MRQHKGWGNPVRPRVTIRGQSGDVSVGCYTSMKTPSSAETLLPRDRGRRTHVTGLPPDLLAQAARRLRIVTILYAFAFFISNPLTAILIPEERVNFLSSAIRWVPSAVSITAALLVAALTWNRRIAVGTVLTVGLVFEVVGSFGIAAAQYPGCESIRNRTAMGRPVLGCRLDARVHRDHPESAASGTGSGTGVGQRCSAGGRLCDGNERRSDCEFSAAVLFSDSAPVSPRSPDRLCRRAGRGTDGYRAASCSRIGQLPLGRAAWVRRHGRSLAGATSATRSSRSRQADAAGSAGRVQPERHSELHARFEREAQATASLRSPHTIELYDFGIADDGSLFYVMELLDGFDLEHSSSGSARYQPNAPCICWCRCVIRSPKLMPRD